MTAPLELANGTVSLPALSFDSDPDCGLYRIGANNVGVAVNGAKVLDVATTGLGVTGALTTTGAVTPAGALAAANGAVGTPSVSFASDPDTGLYRIGVDNLGVSVGGTKVVDATATQVAVPVDFKLTASNPASTTAFTNVLSPGNIPKVLFKATLTIGNTGGGGGVWSATVNAGFGITSITRTSATVAKINFAQAFASAHYVPVITVSSDGLAYQLIPNWQTWNASYLEFTIMQSNDTAADKQFIADMDAPSAALIGGQTWTITGAIFGLQ